MNLWTNIVLVNIENPSSIVKNNNPQKKKSRELFIKIKYIEKQKKNNNGILSPKPKYGLVINALASKSE